MNREEKLKELENTLNKCIKDLEALKQPEFKDGNAVWVRDENAEMWSSGVFKKYEHGLYYIYNIEGTAAITWKQCKPFKTE